MGHFPYGKLAKSSSLAFYTRGFSNWYLWMTWTSKSNKLHNSNLYMTPECAYSVHDVTISLFRCTYLPVVEIKWSAKGGNFFVVVFKDGLTVIFPQVHYCDWVTPAKSSFPNTKWCIYFHGKNRFMHMECFQEKSELTQSLRQLFVCQILFKIH